MDRQFFNGAIRNHCLRGGLAVVGDRILFSKTSDATNLFCVGISHHTANVGTRERYLPWRTGESLRAGCGCAEAVMLATCNRVELYAVARDTVTTEHVTDCLARREAPPGEDGSGFYRYEGKECVRHLFRVVCGLDSI